MEDKSKVNCPPPPPLSAFTLKEDAICFFFFLNFNFRELESKESLTEIQNQLKMIPQ